MFNSKGVGAGTWVGDGTVTRTKATSTLFITAIPSSISVGRVEELFEKEPGFFAFRTVRQMVFVDFQSVVQATNAMRKYQGHKFEGCKGIAIDYDKDPKSKRNRNYEAQRKKEVKADLSRFQTKYSCALCGTRCLTLGKGPSTKNTLLQKLPKRSTGDTVVDEAKYISDVRVTKGSTKLIKRAKGTEKQFRLACTQCGVDLCYRPKPLEEENKYMYVIPDALKLDGEPQVGMGTGEVSATAGASVDANCSASASESASAATSATATANTN
jgi:hypothetical protein